jgi:cytochrome c peroxidase
MCHDGPTFTNHRLHDVTTRDTPVDSRRFDTPTLRGVFATASYPHDGRAATLRDVLTTHNQDDTPRARARRVHDHEPRDAVRMPRGRHPRDHPAPVVAHEDDALGRALRDEPATSSTRCATW